MDAMQAVVVRTGCPQGRSRAVWAVRSVKWLSLGCHAERSHDFLRFRPLDGPVFWYDFKQRVRYDSFDDYQAAITPVDFDALVSTLSGGFNVVGLAGSHSRC